MTILSIKYINIINHINIKQSNIQENKSVEYLPV